MDFYCYHFGCPPEEPRIPDVSSEGYRPPFNNILYLFQNFDFNQWTADFKLYFNDKDPQDEVERYLLRSILPSSAKIHKIQFHSEVDLSVTWEDCYYENPQKEISQISPTSLAREMFTSEIRKSERVFKKQDQYLKEPHMKHSYYLEVFKQLDEILHIFYDNRENFTPFENSFDSFLHWFRDLTYPYFTENSDLHYLRRGFDNIKKQKSKSARNEDPSSIEKIVDMLIADGSLHQLSRSDLIMYLEDGIYSDADAGSVRWLGTADSFAQFIFALRQTEQYKQPGNIKWSHWHNAIKFPGGKTIAIDTLKKLYQKAQKTSDNLFINKINQALSSSLV